MMLKEFIELTGFEPTPEEYSKIEQAYMSNPNESKEDFCKAFMEAGTDQRLYIARAAKIAGLHVALEEQKKRHARICIEYEEEIADLKEALEAEEEWRLVSTEGTQLSEDEYQAFRRALFTKSLSNADAKDIIHKMFGFDPGLIWIIKEVHHYEVNRHGQFREVRTFKRKPLYRSEEENYFRFNCCGQQYEVIDGVLDIYRAPLVPCQ